MAPGMEVWNRSLYKEIQHPEIVQDTRKSSVKGNAVEDKLVLQGDADTLVTDSTELRQVWKNAEFQEHYGQKMLGQTNGTGGTRDNRFLRDPEDISTIPIKDVLAL